MNDVKEKNKCLALAKGCNTFPSKRKVSITGAQRDLVVHAKCKTEEQIAEMSNAQLKLWGQNADWCSETKKGAKQALYNKLKEDISGYPDSWADKLQPGDWLIFYNGNSSFTAAHSVIFLGWGSGGRAQTIQSSYKGNPKRSSYCIRSECAHPQPIMRIFTPQ